MSKTASGLRISCLVTAYRRSTYLRQALRSILQQAADFPDLDIVLLHNIEGANELVDELLRESHSPPSIRLVNCSTPEVGPFFRRGIESCRGDVICFLNDDDTWDPGKLWAVETAFASFPGLAFFRHCFRYIDSDGRGVPYLDRRWTRRRGNLFTRPKSEPVLVPGVPSLPILRRISRLAPYSNDSTMAIRSDCAKEQFPALDRINAAEDSFFFFTALSSGRPLLFSPEALSALRVHGENVSSDVRYTDRVRATFRPLASTLDSTHVITQVADNSGYEFVSRFARHHESQLRMISKFYDSCASRSSVLREAISLSRYSLETSTMQDAGLLFLGLMRVVSPAVTSRLYRASV
ncbi:MAG: glycosyltransferase [Thermoplasmata archaeon]